MADLNFQSFFEWEKEIRGNFPEAPEFTERDAWLEWSRISRKREYAEILDDLQESVEEVTKIEKRVGEFPQNVDQFRLSKLEEQRTGEGLSQAGLQSYTALKETLQRFTMLLIHTNRDDKVVSREWSQKYADRMMEASRRAIDDYRKLVEQCQDMRKRLGSLGAPLRPDPDPFDEDDDEMEEDEDEDIEMDMGEGASLENDGWEFERVLGKGSFGEVSLWVMKDETGKVVERCACKEVEVPDELINRSHPGDRIGGFRRETFMHSTMTSRDPAGRHIVIYRGEDFLFEERVHRVYMELCQYGDLWDVKRRLYERSNKKLQLIAIPMAWALFESLAKAVYLMAFGAFPGAVPPRGWDRMVHRDIKPDNTFLSDPLPDRWPGIPSMKMGDFGLAAFQSERRLQTTYAGTAQYLAPEIHHVGTYKLPEGMVISTPADVWSIGATMVDMMNIGTQKDDSTKFYNWQKNRSLLPKVSAASRRFYPTELVDLVEMCLHPEPRDRIEIALLCEAIAEEVSELSTEELYHDDKMRFPLKDEKRGKIVKLDL